MCVSRTSPRATMRSAVAAALLLTACERSPTAAAPLVLLALAGNGQTVTVGYPVPISPTVTVTSDGRPAAGVPVTFTFPASAGLFTVSAGAERANDTVVISDAMGIARAGTWYMKTSAGVDSLSVSAPGAAPIVFTETTHADVAFGYLKWAGDAQTAAVSSALATAPAIRVIDEFGNGVPGVSAAFSVVNGGGSITGASTMSGVDGVAALGGWTLGSAPGANVLRVVVQATGGPGIPFTFTAKGVTTSAATRGRR